MNADLPIIKNILKSPKCTQLLIEHHLEGLFFHFKLHNNPVIKESWLKQWRHNDTLKKEALSLSQNNPSAKIVYLKGMSLLDDIYLDEGMRFMSDIDILIDKSDYETIETYLQSNGFSLLQTEKFNANSFKKEWTKNVDGVDITIETHTKLYYHVENDISSFQLKKREHLILSFEDQIIHLITHLSFQHTFLKLYWLFDIYFFIKKYNALIDWNLVERKIKNLKIENSFFIVTYLLETQFNLIPLLNKKPKLIWRFIFTQKLLFSSNRRTIRYFIAKHLTKDSLWLAIKYDLSLIKLAVKKVLRVST